MLWTVPCSAAAGGEGAEGDQPCRASLSRRGGVAAASRSVVHRPHPAPACPSCGSNIDAKPNPTRGDGMVKKSGVVAGKNCDQPGETRRRFEKGKAGVATVGELTILS